MPSPTTSMTEAIVASPDLPLQTDRAEAPLAKRVADIADELAAKGAPGGRDLTPAERDAMWSHPI